MFLPSITRSTPMSGLFFLFCYFYSRSLLRPCPPMLIIESISLYFSSINLPSSFLSLCHLCINLSIHMINQFTLPVTLEHDWPLLMASVLADLRAFIGWVSRFCEVGRPTGGSDGINVVFALGTYLLHTVNRTWTLFSYSHPLLMTTFRQDVYELGC